MNIGYFEVSLLVSGAFILIICQAYARARAYDCGTKSAFMTRDARDLRYRNAVHTKELAMSRFVESHRTRPSQGSGRLKIVVELKLELPFEFGRGSRGGAKAGGLLVFGRELYKF